MRRGIDHRLAAGSKEALGWLSTFLAAAYGRAGQPGLGLRAVAEAKELEERIFAAETHRVEGELLLLQRERDERAEACFREAIEIARRQEAKLLELRAAMSLARLLRRQNRADEARQMLSEIYGWFTEGFDTKDLQDAKALLDELA
jgi:predicted ATPase